MLTEQLLAACLTAAAIGIVIYAAAMASKIDMKLRSIEETRRSIEVTRERIRRYRESGA